MPQPIPGTRALPQSQKGFRVGFKAILRPAVDQINGVLLRAAGSDGIIDPRREAGQVRTAGEIIQRVFVSADGRNAYAEDGVTPLSPYAQLINQWVIFVTVKAVRAQRNWLRTHVADDVFGWLARARRPQNVAELVSVAGRLLPTFIPNALAQYDPLHLWVDPNGYRLSDRLWRAGGDTRQRLDALLAEGIRNGESALSISKRAERFLLPGRAALRTQKPYGTDASYRGMVLGRTEITRAHGEATLISARLNPYVTGLDWALSASHPRMDICDQLATIGMGGGRLREPYDLYSVPPYPIHPQCLCSLISSVTSTPAQVTDELRGFMEAGEEAPLTPAADGVLLWRLFGNNLYEWWRRNESLVEVAA